MVAVHIWARPVRDATSCNHLVALATALQLQQSLAVVAEFREVANVVQVLASRKQLPTPTVHALCDGALRAKVEIEHRIQRGAEISPVKGVVIGMEIVRVATPRHNGAVQIVPGVAAFVCPRHVERIQIEEVREEQSLRQNAWKHLRADPKVLLVHAAAVDVCIEGCTVVKVVVHLVRVRIDNGAVANAMLDIECDEEAGPADASQELLTIALLHDRPLKRACGEPDPEINLEAKDAAQDHHKVCFSVEGAIEDVREQAAAAEALRCREVVIQVCDEVHNKEGHHVRDTKLNLVSPKQRDASSGCCIQHDKHHEAVDGIVENAVR
mmetsp:Transcript_103803/g.293501  ORF Transcript_103803/g.293501 Transcript_103803/m.293501 type:complete len:325 (+) Transcript_103803:607-1581(+)